MTRSNQRQAQAEAVDEAPKRYAAFDKTLSKYVGGVRDHRSEAEKIAKGIKDAGHEAEVREV